MSSWNYDYTVTQISEGPPIRRERPKSLLKVRPAPADMRSVTASTRLCRPSASVPPGSTGGRFIRRIVAAAALAGLTVAPLAPGAQAAPAAATATGTLTGTLVRAYVEVGPHEKGEATHRSVPGADQLTWVRTASGRQERVPSSDVVDVPAGSQVRLTVGSRQPGADNVPSAGREVLSTTVTSTPPDTASSPAAPVQGTAVEGTAVQGTARAARRSAATTSAATAVQEITLVQAVPAGTTANGTAYTADATTVADLGKQVDKASAFWSTQTGGRVSLKVVKSLAWTPLTSSCDDPDALWAEAAKRAGWTEDVGRHLVVQLPEAADAGGCGAGLGTVGRFLGDGGMSWTSYSDWAVVAHELGHNFRLGHANSLNCGTAADQRTGCAEEAYGDSYDVMGISWWNTGSLSTAHLDELGLMTSATQREVSSAISATVDLRPVGLHTGLQSMTFVDGGVRYWVEYRGALGYDSWTAKSSYSDLQYNDGFTAGVVVRRLGAESDENSPYYGSRVLLRPRGLPTSTSPQWTLTAGQAMETASHRVIRVSALSETSARVVVDKGLTSVRSTPRTTGQTVSGVAYHRSSSLTVAFTASPRAPRKGYQVLVDGAVRATATPTATSATVTGLTSGRHAVAVRALDTTRYVTSAATQVQVDRSAPTFSTGPSLQLRRGARVAADVPVRLRFAAADSVRLYRVASASPGVVLSPTSTSLSLTQRTGTTVTRTLTATDAAGNTRTATTRTAVRLGSERWATKYAGRWGTLRQGDTLGGAVRRSHTRGASATFSATGRDLGLVATTGPTQGRITVYVDGRSAGTVDLRSTTTSTRRLVWTRHFATTARHSVRVVVQGTTGRPLVSLDGWAVLG
jgi:hypothetical protein